MNEFYQKVAYIGLRNTDGSFLLNVPLYIKVDEINKHGMTDMQEELIHRISNILIHCYEKQIGNHIVKLKKGVECYAKVQS